MSSAILGLRDAGIEEEEEAAFDAAVQRESRRLWILALSILRDKGEAEDAVQETLTKAWVSRRSLDLSAAAPWLTRVCVNHCISRGRRLGSGWMRRSDIVDSLPDPGADTRAQTIDIDRAYRSLSVRQRAAITLNYRHGYSIAECAEIMGCRPGTVRSHLARGLATLRKEMTDE